MYSKKPRMKKFIFTVLSISLFFLACNDTDKVAQEVDKIQLSLEVLRFDREFATATPDNIPALRKSYPYLFPAPDSVWP